jgi:hypothetical protein
MTSHATSGIVTEMQLSPRALAALSAPTRRVTPWSPGEFEKLQRARELGDRHREFEAGLFDASGQRGLPEINGFRLGMAVALAAGAAPTLAPESAGLDETHAPSTVIGLAPDGVGIYLRDDGRVDRPDSGLVSPDVTAWLEQLVLEDDSRWFPAQLLSPRQCAERLAQRLSVPWLVEASDGYAYYFANDAWLLVDRPHGTQIAWALDAPVRTALAACRELGLPLAADSKLPIRTTNLRHDAWSAELEAAAPYRADSVLSTLLDWDESAAELVSSAIRAGELVEQRRFGRELVSVLTPGAAARFLHGLVSPRVISWCEAEGVLRSPSSADPQLLAVLLQSAGVMPTDAILEAEECFGGLVQRGSENPQAVKLRLGLTDILRGDATTRAAIRNNGEESDWLVNDAWPQQHWQTTALLPFGIELDGSIFLLLDVTGAVYSFVPELDELTLSAASVRMFLEQRALRWQARRRFVEFAEVKLDSDVGQELASRLGATLVSEASDRVRRHFQNEAVWLSSQPALGPNYARTTIVARSADDIVLAVRAAKELAPRASVEVDTYRPGGKARLDALRRAGIDVS